MDLSEFATFLRVVQVGWFQDLVELVQFVAVDDLFNRDVGEVLVISGV